MAKRKASCGKLEEQKAHSQAGSSKQGSRRRHILLALWVVGQHFWAKLLDPEWPKSPKHRKSQASVCSEFWRGAMSGWRPCSPDQFWTLAQFDVSSQPPRYRKVSAFCSLQPPAKEQTPREGYDAGPSAHIPNSPLLLVVFLRQGLAVLAPGSLEFICLCSPGWPRTCTDLPAFPFRGLSFQACTTTPGRPGNGSRTRPFRSRLLHFAEEEAAAFCPEQSCLAARKPAGFLKRLPRKGGERKEGGQERGAEERGRKNQQRAK